MSKIISYLQIKELIKKASLFTTGGGVSYFEQLVIADKLKNAKIEIKQLSEFPKNSYIVQVGEIGPSNAPQIPKNIAPKMLSLLGKISNKNIAGIYPPELGQESVVLESANYLNLPIADIDVAGFRAVPFMDIDIFTLNKKAFSYAPLVLCNDQGEIFPITKIPEEKKIEDVLREMTKLSSQGILFYIAGLISVEQILKMKVGRLYSHLLELGEINNYKDLMDKLQPQIHIRGEVWQKKEQEKKGFLFEEVIIRSDDKKYKLIILNEALSLYDQQGREIASVPERILLIDPKLNIGITSGELEIGKQIGILVLPALEEWQTNEANKLFGKERFKGILELPS